MTPARQNAGRTWTAMAFVGCSANFAVGNATWWMQPFLIEEFAAAGRMSFAQIGFAISVELAMMALISAGLARQLRSGSFRTIGLVGGGVAIAASMLSLWTVDFSAFVLARALVGAGEGCCLFVANAALVSVGNPDRLFPRMQTGNVLLGVAMVLLLPVLHFATAQPFSLVFLALSLVLMVALCALLPGDMRLDSTGGGQSPQQRSQGLRISAGVGSVAVAAFMIGVASGSIWSFYVVVGLDAGMTEDAVNKAIAFAVMMCIGSSAAASAIGGRMGRSVPIVVATALVIIGILLLSLNPSSTGFRIGTTLNVAGLYFGLPFIFASGAVMDPSGRGAALIASAYFFAGAIAPSFGGLFAGSVGVTTLGVLAAVMMAVAAAIIVWAEYRHRHGPNARSARE